MLQMYTFSQPISIHQQLHGCVICLISLKLVQISPQNLGISEILIKFSTTYLSYKTKHCAVFVLLVSKITACNAGNLHVFIADFRILAITLVRNSSHISETSPNIPQNHCISEILINLSTTYLSYKTKHCAVFVLVVSKITACNAANLHVFIADFRTLAITWVRNLSHISETSPNIPQNLGISEILIKFSTTYLSYKTKHCAVFVLVV